MIFDIVGGSKMGEQAKDLALSGLNLWGETKHQEQEERQLESKRSHCEQTMRDDC